MAPTPTPTPAAPSTRGGRMTADISALLRARNALLWIVSREEQRAERAIVDAGATASYPVRFWDCASGITDAKGATIRDVRDPSAALDYVRETRERAVYVLRDLHKWLDPLVLRSLRNLARSQQAVARDERRAIILLTPSTEVPPELAGHATVLEYPLPDRAEIAAILDDVISSIPPELAATAVPNGARDAAIDAAVGLTAEEAQNCYARSLVTSRTIDPALVSGEKKRVIARERVLTWYDPDPRGMDAIGGLANLKTWLRARKSALTARARAYGLPSPKGALLVGVPGCGKSLAAKCLASAWGIPLLRLDLGALMSKFVGESQTNMRKALAVAEACAPCVLWVDEVEKALAGSTGAQGDGGVSADQLATLLSWMQDHTGAVFVLATANDVRSLPPELLRKGRFDEVFWVDLPTTGERAEILRATLTAHRIAPDAIDLPAVARACAGFAGAEIAAIVPDAMFAAFAEDERPVTTADLIGAASNVVPLSQTAAEKIAALRDWAKGRARPASPPESAEGPAVGRALDL